jgi:hypothetical protein
VPAAVGVAGVDEGDVAGEHVFVQGSSERVAADTQGALGTSITGITRHATKKKRRHTSVFP